MGYALLLAPPLPNGMGSSFLTDAVRHKFRKVRSLLGVHVPSTVKWLREQGLWFCGHPVFSSALYYHWEKVCHLIVA